MTAVNEQKNHSILQRIAHEAMLDKGLFIDFPPEVIEELNNIKGPAQENDSSIKDLRNLLWCSVDNDESRDLDQLSVAVDMPDGNVKILVAIADVDSLVKKNSQIDLHASHNTTSVYTPVEIFPMLPERLSTDLTSLNFESERLAIVVEMVVSNDGSIQSSDIYRGLVFNRAKLSYNSVSAWLDGESPVLDDISAVPGLAENIQQQYMIAQKLKALRHQNGALNFDTLKAKTIFEGDIVKEVATERNNSSKDMIEDFMIAANGVSARFLASKNFPSIRRIVRTPKRWDRIIQLVSEYNYNLPQEPDSKALDEFLLAQKAKDPLRFPDLSLSIIKLLGAGEYVVEVPGQDNAGHFGLAVKDYSHSTAPNRRYPDLITQRLLKSAIAGKTVPYTVDELTELAKHCTETENLTKKVERQVEKSTGILLIQSKIGQQFKGIVTGASNKGVWVRLFAPQVDGKLINPPANIDVGDKLRVELIHTDVEKGFIDFKAIAPLK